MMTSIAVPVSASGSYGALELKHDYRKHMLLAVIIAAALHLGMVGGILLWQATRLVPVQPEPPVIVVDGTTVLKPLPPMVTHEPALAHTEMPVAIPKGLIPKPMPDEEVLEDAHIPTIREREIIAASISNGAWTNDGAQAIVVQPPCEVLPKADEFVACQVEPVTIHYEAPAYPEIAALTGQTGTVWIRALVDTEGHVRDAIVQKPSGTNVGFEEAARSAAFQNVYKPAIQNGRPVAVWITYRVVFKLH